MQLGIPCSFSDSEKQTLRQLSLEQVRQCQSGQPVIVRLSTPRDVGEHVHFLGYDAIQVQLKILQRPKGAVRIEKLSLSAYPLWVSYAERNSEQQSAGPDGTFSRWNYNTLYVMKLFSADGQGKTLAGVERQAAILELWQDANWEYDHCVSIEVGEGWDELESAVFQGPNAGAFAPSAEPPAFQPRAGTWMVEEVDAEQQQTGRRAGPFQREDAEEIARELSEVPEEVGWSYRVVEQQQEGEQA